MSGRMSGGREKRALEEWLPKRDKEAYDRYREGKMEVYGEGSKS